jgi:hypothetical protein
MTGRRSVRSWPIPAKNATRNSCSRTRWRTACSTGSFREVGALTLVYSRMNDAAFPFQP